jgi:hypothetical protein
MYDEGIDLNTTIRGNRVQTGANVRVLGHIRTDCINVSIPHHSINGQRAPVSLSLAKRE